MELPNQKGFYDSRRQFQGHDDPQRAGDPVAAPGGIPRGQLIAGVIFLLLIALAFFKFAPPEKQVGAGAHEPLTTAPAKAH
ncbi:MAG: hypothetical protein EXR72_17620 [Myxococcales bacterium]|nr:hypothetical protein [Myxococcales bacterium]